MVLASLEAEIARDSGEWPDSFFDPPNDAERAVLAEAIREIEDAIAAVAASHGAEIVTANLAHFSRITTLTSRHW